VILAQFMLLMCILPLPVEFIFAATVSMGTCSYAVLVVDRPWLRGGIVIACHIIFGVLLAQTSLALFLVAIMPLALWTGLLVIIKGWARTGSGSERLAEKSSLADR
jgi:hypothetical protein